MNKTIATLSLIALGIILVTAQYVPFTLQPGPHSLDWGMPSTNNSTMTWQQWTNGSVLRYNGFWTLVSNVDSGTNFMLTSNWNKFVDANSSMTSSPMWMVPTGTLVTFTITLPGGKTTIPVIPYFYTNYPGVYITNQPASP